MFFVDALSWIRWANLTEEAYLYYVSYAAQNKFRKDNVEKLELVFSIERESKTHCYRKSAKSV